MTVTCRTCPWFDDRPVYDQATIGVPLSPEQLAYRFCEFRPPDTMRSRASQCVIHDPDTNWCSQHPREQSKALLRMMAQDLKAYQAKPGRTLDL